MLKFESNKIQYESPKIKEIKIAATRSILSASNPSPDNAENLGIERSTGW